MPKATAERVATFARGLVFVGDAGQLPPVGEKFPMVAQSELIDTEATLNEVVRYDGDIAHVAEYIRTHKQYRDYLYPFNTTSDKLAG